MKTSDDNFEDFKKFLVWAKTLCGGCGAEYKSDLLTCARCKLFFIVI